MDQATNMTVLGNFAAREARLLFLWASPEATLGIDLKELDCLIDFVGEEKGVLFAIFLPPGVESRIDSPPLE